MIGYLHTAQNVTKTVTFCIYPHMRIIAVKTWQNYWELNDVKTDKK